VDWPERAPKSKFRSKQRITPADLVRNNQDRVLERSLALAKTHSKQIASLFDFWRLDDQHHIANGYE